MKQIYLFLVLSFIVCSCVSVDYIGKSYPSTSHVEVYMDENDITAPYEVMGELIAETDDNFFINAEKMQNKLMEEARQKGADAIILGSLQKRVSGEGTTTSSETKIKDDKIKTTEQSETHVNEKKELRARLIKFKK